MAENQQPANPFLGGNPTTPAAAREPAPQAAPPTAPPRSAFSIRPASPSSGGPTLPPRTNVIVPPLPTPSPSPTPPPPPRPAPQVIPGPSLSAAPGATERFLAPPPRAGVGRRLFIWGGILGLILLIAFGVYWWWSRGSEPGDEPSDVPSSSSEAIAPTAVLPEASAPATLEDEALYRSENFKAGEIVFLGEAEFLLGDEGIAPLTLDGIRGEAFTEKNKQEVKLVITWTTNKLAKAEVGYAKGIGQTPKVVETEDFAYDHSLILTGLDPASTYLYTIKATDRFGNAVTSEPYAVFTGARSVSLFDLIAGALGEVFGWAVK